MGRSHGNTGMRACMSATRGLGREFGPDAGLQVKISFGGGGY